MSTFQSAIAFFNNLGLYDVVLPFFLVFTLVFAMLEKTKVLGFENKEKGTTKKNLNAMLAFVSGFLVVASAELVRVINEVMANVVLLLLLSVLFLLLAGSFHADAEFSLGDGWKKFFMVVMFVGIALIFLNALGWLEAMWRYLTMHLDGPVVGSFLMIIVVLAAMWMVIQGGSSGGGDDN